MSVKIGIIADDVTGCGDIGLQFKKKKFDVLVLLSVKEARKYDIDRYDVVIINTESRAKEPSIAARRVKKALKYFDGLSVDKIYKKIDSTLRGNIGQEIDALFEDRKIKGLPFCAAFPDMGRYTKDGHHYVFDKLLEDTIYARDPKNPIKESNIKEILRKSAKNWDRVNVYDASTNEDIRKIAYRVASHSVICGAASLAGELADIWSKSMGNYSGGVDTCAVKKPKERHNGQVVVVSGSANTTTYEQIKELIIQRKVSLIEADKFVRLPEKEDFVICPGSGKRDPREIMKCISALTKKEYFREKVQNFIIVGGETAYGVLMSKGVSAFIIKGDVLPGIAWAGSMDKKYSFLLKPGGFGGKDALIRCFDFFKK